MDGKVIQLALLLRDPTFASYFNAFCELHIWPKRLHYIDAAQGFIDESSVSKEYPPLPLLRP